MLKNNNILNLDKARENGQNNVEQNNSILDKLIDGLNNSREILAKKAKAGGEVLKDLINLVETLSGNLKAELKTEDVNLSEQEVKMAQNAIKESAKTVLLLKQELGKIAGYKKMAGDLLARNDSENFDLQNSQVLSSKELLGKMPLSETMLLGKVGDNQFVLIPYKNNKGGEGQNLEISGDFSEDHIAEAIGEDGIKIQNISETKLAA